MEGGGCLFRCAGEEQMKTCKHREDVCECDALAPVCRGSGFGSTYKGYQRCGEKIVQLNEKQEKDAELLQRDRIFSGALIWKCEGC